MTLDQALIGVAIAGLCVGWVVILLNRKELALPPLRIART